MSRLRFALMGCGSVTKKHAEVVGRITDADLAAACDADAERADAFGAVYGDSGIHYPIPLHRQPAYAHLGLAEGAYSASEALARQILSLPMYPELTPEQVEFVAEQVVAAVDGG